MDADESFSPTEDDRDAAHTAAAEQIRAGLVRLRGGAPFLSPADTALLVRWLDDGITVARILAALEITASRRLALRTRAPLELRHAKRQLGAHPASPRAVDGPCPPDALALDLEALTAAFPDAARRLSTTLATLQGTASAASDRAAGAVIRFFDEAWTSLGEAGRARYLDQAATTLGASLDALDDARRAAALEACARALLRADVPGLTITRVLSTLPS